MENQTKDLSVLQRYGALAVTANDPRLPAIASSLGFKSSERLLIQIHEHIPAALEQQIYMTLVSDGYGLRPMKFAEILQAHRGGSPLTTSAFERKEISPNVFFSNIDELQEFIDTIVTVVEGAKDSDFTCSTRSAIIIVQTYGDHAEKVLDSILKEADEIWYQLGKKVRKGDGPGKMASFAVNFLARKIIPACQKVGVSAPLTVMNFFEDDGYARARALCMDDGQAVNIFPAYHTDDGGSSADE